MNTLILEHETLATSLDFSEDSFMVHLNDGRWITIPLAWYPRLHHATRNERKNYQLTAAVKESIGRNWMRTSACKPCSAADDLMKPKTRLKNGSKDVEKNSVG